MTVVACYFAILAGTTLTDVYVSGDLIQETPQYLVVDFSHADSFIENSNKFSRVTVSRDDCTLKKFGQGNFQ